MEIFLNPWEIIINVVYKSLLLFYFLLFLFYYLFFSLDLCCHFLVWFFRDPTLMFGKWMKYGYFIKTCIMQFWLSIYLNLCKKYCVIALIDFLIFWVNRLSKFISDAICTFSLLHLTVFHYKSHHILLMKYASYGYLNYLTFC